MKRNALKSIAAFALGTVMLGSLAACGGNNPNDYAEYDENGNLILTIWAPDQYAGGQVRAQFQAFIDKFNETEELQELGVTLQFQPMNQLPTSLRTACMSGPTRMPDIVIWDRFSTPSNTSFLLPLDDLIQEDAIDTTKFLAEAYDELTVDGVQYGLPLDADPWGIYVNMDLVNTYNDTASEADKIDVDSLDTWTELLDAAEKLTERDGSNVTRSGLNTTSADGQFFSFIYTGTGELINTDETDPNYGDTVMKESAAEMLSDGQSLRVYDTLAFFNELYHKNLCNTGHGGTDAFGNDLCAMTYGSLYFPQELSAYSLENYKMLPYPARDRTYVQGEDSPQVLDPAATDASGMVNGQVGGMLGGYGLAIPQPIYENMRTEEWRTHVDKAWEVIKLWLMNDEINELYFTENGAITCRQDLWTNEFYTENTGVIGDILPYIQNYKMRPSVAGYETFESSVVRSEIQSLREGSQTVLTTYSDIRSMGNALLRQAQGRA